MSEAERPAHNRPALIVLVVVAAVTCLALGWWQWQRFDSAAGTGQNLGYALQWPLFAGFAVFAYFRFVRLEQENTESAEEPDTDTAGSAAEAHDTDATRCAPEQQAAGQASSPSSAPTRRTTRKRQANSKPREIPAGILPEPPKAATTNDTDPVLTEYNSYLAQLHADDVGEQVRGAGSQARDTERSAG